jgi:hypothetical protein
MAVFIPHIPDAIMEDIERLYVTADSMFGEMTQAGAKVVYSNVMSNLPASFRTSNIRHHIEITKVYYTKSDGAINTKVGIYGYFKNKRNRRVPAPLVANIFEYGKSNFLKQPFFRQSFNKEQIYKAMIEQQSLFLKRNRIKVSEALMSAYYL